MTKAKQWTFKADDMFEDIPGDLDNVNMNIPLEVAESAGFMPGDKLKILWGDQGTIIIEKIKEEEPNGKKED